MATGVPILVYGHRGSAGTHPENTIPAFKEAVNSGADFFELDLHLSKDEKPVIFHDAYVSDRLCVDHQGKLVTTPLPVRHLTAQELAHYDCGQMVQPRFPEQKIFPHCLIPTLEDLFRWVVGQSGSFGINLEIKIPQEDPVSYDPQVISQKVLDLIERFHLHSRTQIQSYDPRVVRAVSHLKPEQTTGLLLKDKPYFSELAASEKVTNVVPLHSLVTAEEVERCHDRGIGVLPWSVNEPKEWERLIDCNVDGIITDFPRALVEFLRQAKRKRA